MRRPRRFPVRCGNGNYTSHVNQMHGIACEEQSCRTLLGQEREPAVEFLGVTHFDRTSGRIPSSKASAMAAEGRSFDL